MSPQTVSKLRRILSLGALLSCFGASVALAHAQLRAAAPAKDSETASPAEVVLTFSEAVTPAIMTLADQGGHEVKAVGTPKADGNTLHLPITAKLAPGLYTVTYRIAGADTHVVNGTLAFTVTK